MGSLGYEQVMADSRGRHNHSADIGIPADEFVTNLNVAFDEALTRHRGQLLIDGVHSPTSPCASLTEGFYSIDETHRSYDREEHVEVRPRRNVSPRNVNS